MNEALDVLHREFVYIWYYFDVQLRQVFGYWVLGIVLGYIVSMAANHVLPMISSDIDVTVSPSFNSIAVAFGISVFIGVLFGYLPAKRAAR